MRRITIRHRDERGKTEYFVFETVDQLLEAIPDSNVVKRIEQAKIESWLPNCYILW